MRIMTPNPTGGQPPQNRLRSGRKQIVVNDELRQIRMRDFVVLLGDFLGVNTERNLAVCFGI